MKMNKLLLSLLAMFSIFTAHAANTSSSISVELYGDGNYLYESPYAVVNGYNNQALDGYGGKTRSTETANITGSNNYLVTGEFNSAFGNNNSITGGAFTQSAHVFGNGNSTSTAGSSTIGNNNIVNGDNNATIGSNNKTSGNGVAIGNNNTSAANGVAIGNGATANANEVNFGSSKNLTGVETGVADTDAVNVEQTNQKFEDILEDARDYTNDTFSDAKNTANNYTDQKVFELLNDSTIDFSKDNAYASARLNQLNKKLNKARKEINGGVAGAIATTSVPYKLGNRFSFGLGVGAYKSEMAAAIGVKWGISKNIAVGSAITFNSQSDTGLSLSFAYGF